MSNTNPQRSLATEHGVARSADDWFRIGESALRRGNLQEAHGAFSSAVDLDASHPNALFRLGELAQSDGDVQTAIGFYRRTLTAQPGHGKARERLRQIAAAPKKEGPPYGPFGNGVVGIVRGVRQSTVGGLAVMTFRPDLFDWFIRIEQRRPEEESGRMVSARMRGHNLVGDLQQGDWVELPRRWRPGRKLKRLTNLEVNERVEVNRGSRTLKLLHFIVTLLVIIWIVAGFAMVAPELIK